MPNKTPSGQIGISGQEAGRTRILEAARAIFEDKGSAGLSMRAIAAAAGMPTMTVYGYYPSKTAIIRALWSLAFQPLFQQMLATEDAIEDATQRLLSVAEVYVQYWIQNPDKYRMVFLTEDRRETAKDSWFIDQPDVVASYMRFGALIAAARGQPEVDHLAEAEALVCALTGIAHMTITVSEYPWRTPAVYIRMLASAFIA